MNTSSRLLIDTIPTLVRIIEPDPSAFNPFSRKYKYDDFMEVSPSRIAQITEIVLG
jgi:hypothetical protein